MDDDMSGSYTTTDYSDKFLMPSLDHIAIDPSEYQGLFTSGTDHHHHHHHQHYDDNQHRIPVVFGSNGWPSAAPVAVPEIRKEQGGGEEAEEEDDDEEDDDHDAPSITIKSKIASHPLYPRLLQAYIDCQKVGAPPEMVRLFEEILQDNEACNHDGTISTCLGTDPELDQFMEMYCNILCKYKSDLSRPFDEATTFLNRMHKQLSSLYEDDGALSSDKELSGGDAEQSRDEKRRGDDREIKDSLLRRYGSRISSLRLEFSKKKKKEKLPKEARQSLLQWWHLHYTWPYPTEVEKMTLARSTGLDQKQINNWFINQRKRHWKPAEHMQLAVMDNNHSGQDSLQMKDFV